MIDPAQPRADVPWRKTVPNDVAFGPDIEPDQREFPGDGSFESILGDR